MPSEAPSLQRLSPSSSVLCASPTPRRSVRLGLRPCAVGCSCHPHRSRSLTFNAFLSLRAVSATPGERDGPFVELLPIACCLHPTWKGSASPILVTRLHLSSLRARPADSQLLACNPEHSGSASAGHLAMSRREPRYPFRSTFFGVNSFHSTRKASLRDAPKAPRAPRPRSGSPRQSPTEGPHRSGRAGFPHPALRSRGSLRATRLCRREERVALQ